MASACETIDPRREGLGEAAEELGRPFILHAAVVAEQVAGLADIGFGLLENRHVEEHQGLAEMVIGAEAADPARRDADHRRRLPAPDALAIGPRADVDRVLEKAR